MHKSDASKFLNSSHKVPLHTEQLALYERYGALAYGVILQLIPETSAAQEVLVEVFTSAQVLACNDNEHDKTLCVVRTARAKAIAYKQRNMPNQVIEIKGKSLPEQVFNLAFHQGLSPDAIAETLAIPREAVLKAINEHFKNFRKS